MRNYWDEAGETGYRKAMFKGSLAGEHIYGNLCSSAIEAANALGVPPDARVLDLGCGDGFFSNTVLSKHYAHIDGIDISQQAVASAMQNRPSDKLNFRAHDITALDYASLGTYDAVFMIGVLHHVKPHAERILGDLAHVTNKIIVIEPKGNIIRKLLERTEAHKAAGEESFRKRQLRGVLVNAGYEIKMEKNVNIFPNFIPDIVFKILKPIEPFIERTPALHFLCTNWIYALEPRMNRK